MRNSNVSLLFRVANPSNTLADASFAAALGATGERFFPAVGGGTKGWIAGEISDSAGRNAWDVAHDALNRIDRLGLAAKARPELIEPNLPQDWIWSDKADVTGTALAAADVCRFDDQDPALPMRASEFAWHLKSGFSQLDTARSAVAAGGRIRIAHLDTGYDGHHSAFAGARISAALQRNFIDADRPNDARDLGVTGTLKNPGHGTGTLSILAGGRFRFNEVGYTFDGLLGGAPSAEIVPIRVGNSVVQLTTSAVAHGINYAVQLCANEATRIHVMSMSMGGVASNAWADAVNAAYEAGIVYVAAAGNNYSVGGLGGFPTRHIVYPARFRRVIAACGVMADRTPYFGLSLGTMQGNWGPSGAMATALAAFTPNIPWAQWGCAGIVCMNGAGTSSATPQIAAAAALYLEKYADVLFDRNRFPKPWMRVEAVRRALFQSADTTADGGSREKLGNGILRANDALAIAPPAAASLTKTDRDSAGFPFLNVLSGTGLAAPQAEGMLQLEAAQLAQRAHMRGEPNPFEALVSDPDRPATDIPRKEIDSFLEALSEHPAASRALRERVQRVLVDSGRVVKPPVTPQADVGDAPRKKAAIDMIEHEANPVPPLPPERKLRGYAIDPSLSTRLDCAKIAEITFRVPWEELKPGPIGEYLEVVDIDPASRTFYAPVDLDHKHLLAQDGLPPAEGVPQFHQQMVYAVASLTIRNFEFALGRKTLWRPGPAPSGKHLKNDSRFVPQLRIYPHALREANAYYSPNKVALLFGYFDSIMEKDGRQLPGGKIFTCLSHDIVAHETTHALLDGMHRRFLLPSNPDVLAFHEAFADCVAMLQRFTFSELVAAQIQATRGELDIRENMLTQLALQFGFATGQRTALRDATGNVETGQWLREVPNPMAYETTVEPHARGRILVAAIFDAFLSIYRTRTSDLIRLASDGTGILRPGAIHPDLVKRLSDEVAKSSQHVLTMCIRALDYCPPSDITFGEFLRAIITADSELMENDSLNYRISFIEAFQRRGIYPPGVRSLSAGSLKWRTVDEEAHTPSKWLRGAIGDLRRAAGKMMYAKSRREIFYRQRRLRKELHGGLRKHFGTRGEDQTIDARFLGIDPRSSFEVHSARVAFHARPDGSIAPQLLVGLLQGKSQPIDPADPNGPQMKFEGGCTIVVDLREGKMQYCIRKDQNSVSRMDRQRKFALREFGTASATYLGIRGLDDRDDNEPFAIVHRGG